MRISVGIVGAVGRGGSFRNALESCGARVHAVCDIQADKLDECAARFGAAEKYTDYAEMLEKSDLDAVVIGTPMPLHVPQSIEALKRDIHVLCEVPAGVSIEECQSLVAACRKSKAIYMMAENYIYARPIQVVSHLARRGLLGEIYYAEGEYLHELKELNEITKWRRHWQTGIDGITYGTHSLGPILHCMPGDRVVRVCCEGSGRHYKDPRGQPYHQESAVMLGKTAKGALLKIRVDMISDRPHAMNVHQLQGTDGVFESSRGGPGDRHRIWFRELSRQIRWHDLDELMTVDSLAGRYLPPGLKDIPPEALRAGHGGSDYFVVLDFVRAVRGEIACPIGVHEAMDMTLPGLVSQQSIARGGGWMNVPDSREWTEAGPYVQLQMIWPIGRLESPPAPKVPPGYELRCWRCDDEAGYIALMTAAGFSGWDHDRIAGTLRTVLPGGFFVIEHKASGKIVATAMATHNPIEGHPYGGELGWVAADPEHKGKGLGMAVTAAATARLIRGGYTDIFLRTDDWRLPALKIYLQLGYEPLHFREGMQQRWQEVYGKLNWQGPQAKG
jgi:predicted dehydrogenase/GNAT superfamily N-acetyltransferase